MNKAHRGRGERPDFESTGRAEIQILVRWILALVLFCALAACTAGRQVVDHSFGFDTRWDNQDAVVLDYRYGHSKLPVHAAEEAVRRGQTFAFNSVSGPMLRGDDLYVKWRSKSTGQVYEDTVDLRDRLPADITDHTIYFMIRGPQLYVYLVPPKSQKRPPGVPPNGPGIYSHLNVTTIYPDQPKP